MWGHTSYPPPPPLTLKEVVCGWISGLLLTWAPPPGPVLHLDPGDGGGAYTFGGTDSHGETEGWPFPYMEGAFCNCIINYYYNLDAITFHQCYSHSVLQHINYLIQKLAEKFGIPLFLICNELRCGELA